MTSPTGKKDAGAAGRRNARFQLQPMAKHNTPTTSPPAPLHHDHFGWRTKEGFLHRIIGKACHTVSCYLVSP
eukprot:scaffold12283_cov47-Attheya_sp.AAC.1